MTPRFAVFASGNGSNFEAVVTAVRHHNIEADLVCLVCDKPDAYVIERAKKSGISYFIFEKIKGQTKASYESHILEVLQGIGIEYIVLAGYMKIIGQTLLDAYPQKIINLHPSLLPKYPGRQSIFDCFYAGEGETGITIHLVDEGIDTGPIIFQQAVKIEQGDTLADVEARVHRLEHKYYPVIIEEWMNKRSDDND